jgi:hypothetical protein
MESQRHERAITSKRGADTARRDRPPAVGDDWLVDPVLVIGCSVGLALCAGGAVVANGILNSDWSLNGSGLFDRASDSGSLGLLLAVAFSGILSVVTMALTAMAVAWRHRRAASVATDAMFQRHGPGVKDGHGTTGAGHLNPWGHGPDGQTQECVLYGT